jgi:hypothetical protein
MVGIDVDVADALQTVLPAQHLRGHRAVVEHAEAGRMAARRSPPRSQS